MATMGGTRAQKVAYMLETGASPSEAKATTVRARQAAAAKNAVSALRVLGFCMCVSS